MIGLALIKKGKNMSIMIIATLELNSADLLADWKEISDEINADLKANAKGFIARDSVIDDAGLVYCVLKWESVQDSETFMQGLMSRPDFMAKMAEFSRVVKMESMTKKILKII